jgi:hypothetical protein
MTLVAMEFSGTLMKLNQTALHQMPEESNPSLQWWRNLRRHAANSCLIVSKLSSLLRQTLEFSLRRVQMQSFPQKHLPYELEI